VATTPDLEVTFKLRRYQLELWRDFRRFSVFVCHRRFGKTFLALAKMVTEALETNRSDWRGFYICPTFKQAKRIAWAYLVRWSSRIPGCKRNVAELSIEFGNGSRIELLGAERYDTLRGLYADRVVLDETALIPSAALTQVILPMLADRQGHLLAIGTPAGRANLFWELLQEAQARQQEGDPEWSWQIHPVSETGVILADELKRQRRLMSDEEYQQEFECSFNAAIRGAYYARELAALEAAGRFAPVPYDRAYPVHVALDLGYSDAMVAIFSQTVGREERILLARGYERTAIPEMLDDWSSLPYRPELVILPHDARVKELGTGLSRQEIFEARGYATAIAPSQSIHEGINAVRELMPMLWLDRAGCAMLREAIAAYRADYDEVRRAFRTKPLHDWSSHWADALRYLALGRGLAQPWGPRGRLNKGGR
jgi:hypothetical protein